MINGISFLISAIILILGTTTTIKQDLNSVHGQNDFEHVEQEHTSPDNSVTIPNSLKKIFTKVTSMNFFIGIISLATINIIGAGMEPLINLSLPDNNIISNNYGYSLLIFNIITALGFLSGSIINIEKLNQNSFAKNLIIMSTITALYCIDLITIQNGIIFLILIFLEYFMLAKLSPKLMSGIIEYSPARELPVIMSKLGTILSICTPIGTVIFSIMYMTLGYEITFLLLIVFVIDTITLILSNKFVSNNK